ncbi:MAG: hypothetical protein KKG78_06320 [Alphaproteobacteria bacterium]|nr:hypothetical protein [Alphaproteobacteria bacterium]
MTVILPLNPAFLTARVGAANGSGRKGFGVMRTDPEFRGASGNDSGPDRVQRRDTGSGDLHQMIEQVVVRTCFGGNLQAASSADCLTGNRPQAATSNAATHKAGQQCPGASVTMTRALSHDQTTQEQAGQIQPGASTMEGVKRFISVLDKVYAKALSDGDFDFVGFMRARSLGPSEMLDLIEACVVRLGEEWSCDSLGFATVTIATSRLQRVLATLSQENRCFDPGARERSMLFIVPRGEMHLFAVNLMEERFRLRGWETSMVIADRLSDLPHLLATSDFRLVCIAWLDCTLKKRVESVLHAIHTSVNRDRTCVIAGGPAAAEHSGWLEERGVEKICSNAQIALDTAERLGATRISAQIATGINGSLLEPLRSA